MDNRPLPPHHEQMFLAPPHHHHPHYPVPLHRCAPECDDQLAVFSTVGRGLRGDSYKVELKTTPDGHQYLEGMIYDAATNTWSTDWVSNTIDGGKLTYMINKNFATNPPTFTITFHYTNPSHPEDNWTETTPAIPYIPDMPEPLIGLDELAKILGLTPQQIQDILGDDQDVIEGEGFTGDNIKNYVDNLAEHIHEDMGFGDILINDGNADTQNPKRNTIKKWIDWILSQISDLENDLNDLDDQIHDDLNDLDDHIHEDMGFGTILVNDGDSDTKTPKRNTIKKWIDWLITQLGFGADFNEFGGGTITTLKQYIDAKESTITNNIINQTANPRMYVYTQEIMWVFYQLQNAALNVPAIPTTINPSNASYTLSGVLRISYFDTLPRIEIEIQADPLDQIGYARMGPSVVAVVCQKNKVNNNWIPLNLGSINLVNRGSNLKPPLLDPSRVSNIGYIESGIQPESGTGNWQIYTSVGNMYANTANNLPDHWRQPGSNEPFYAFSINRQTEYGDRQVMVDGNRVYTTGYDQAIIG